MIKVRFIHDGRHKGWRYRENEVVLLPDSLALLSINEGMAVPVTEEKSFATNRKAQKAETRSLT